MVGRYEAVGRDDFLGKRFMSGGGKGEVGFSNVKFDV